MTRSGVKRLLPRRLTAIFAQLAKAQRRRTSPPTKPQAAKPAPQPKKQPPTLAEKEQFAFSPETAKANRTAQGEHTKELYEDHWGRHKAGIQDSINRGETMAHILYRLRSRPHAKVSYNRVAGRIGEAVAGSFDIPSGERNSVRLSVAGGRYFLTSSIDPLASVFSHATNYGHIVELGSGPGWNLLELTEHLGTAGADKHLYGLEYTDAGRDILTLLATAYARNISSLPFDYRDPDLSRVTDDGRPRLIFSNHSIEQVEEISGDLYDQIAARSGPTLLIHSEPIGWQRFDDLADARLRDDRVVFNALISSRDTHLRSARAVAVNAAINSWRLGYNRNALRLIREKAAEHKATIQNVFYDFTWLHNSNAVNCTTYLEVHFLGRGHG